MRVRFFDPSRQAKELAPEIQRALAGVDTNAQFANGLAVSDFETQLSEHLDIPHVIAVASGSAALECAFTVAGMQRGDELWLPALTWISTASAAVRLGAKLRFVDVDGAGLIDLKVDPPKDAWTAPVHLGGRLVSMQDLLQRCDPNRVIEDCAQSLGSTTNQRNGGSWGLVGITSFYPTKNLGGHGDGGALLTHDADVAERARRYRNHGLDNNGNVDSLGWNARMNSYQAAVLSVKLPHLDRWAERRREIARRYTTGLESTAVRTLSVDPESAPNVFSVFHPRRDALRSVLEELGIETKIYYRRGLHSEPALIPHTVEAVELPGTDAWCASQLALPIYPELRDEEVDDVIRAVIKACDAL